MITYKEIKEISCEDLKELFLSVQWESGKYPDKLKLAMLNSHSVITAWDGEKLVGLINSMSDGVMNVYFQYLLINPHYQRNGIGKKLLEMMLGKYKTYFRKTLIAYSSAVEFYKKCGLEEGDNNLIPMYGR